MGSTGKRKAGTTRKLAANYQHPTAESLMRPDLGTQTQFKKRLAPKKYRYDDSLSPSLEWDEDKSARDRGEALLRQALDAETIESAKAAVSQLLAMSRPFLNWSGKAERSSIEVPTLPLFIHERLSTKAILETLKGHERDRRLDMFDLFGDPRHSISDQIFQAYEHKDKWVNRMILGDSLVVMHSLLCYESLGGQVQMIYMDPPYGVNFGSNFQPFVRNRNVPPSNNDDDMTREPEMVQAYRDTWSLGVHSYLTFLRDRLSVARLLLHPTGSIFVQIDNKNVHHVRELMDEIFGQENFVALISFSKNSGFGAKLLPIANDYLIWYARDKERVKYRQLYKGKALDFGGSSYNKVLLPDGTVRPATQEEKSDPSLVPKGARLFMHDNITKPGPGSRYTVEFNGKPHRPEPRWWGTTPEGMQRLISAGRVVGTKTGLAYVRFLDDFPAAPLSNVWNDTMGQNQFGGPKMYVVQTALTVVERCMLMTTDPGDLVLDPTCGSGTTAYVAEKWGRRWVTVDASRVPLALARQRLLTATFDWYELKDQGRGPAAGFVYKRAQNKRGEEVGGIIPHVTMETIANSEPPGEEIIVDRPEERSGIVRVTGPFTIEATIPVPSTTEAGDEAATEYLESHESFVDRMTEILRKSPILKIAGNKSVRLSNVRLPAKTLSLSAEAVVLNGAENVVALVFGPENGAVTERLVFEAAREARVKDYAHLYVIGFAIQPDARLLIDRCADAVGIAATYVQVTTDVILGDLLKNMRSSQIFSVCGLPEVEVLKIAHDGAFHFQVKLLGYDVFDSATMQATSRTGDDVPAWFLDTDYNGLCFHVSQAFFPRTGAWEALKKSLKGEYEDEVWGHLASTLSAPFDTGEHGRIAVKVVDDRGNELMVVRSLSEVTS